LLLERCHRALTDAEPGGGLLHEERARAAGTVAAILRAWRERIEGATPTPADQDGRR
jgi:hypothetical protein